ncbi:hypothetical protein LGM14_22720 [Burkholderia multivorans]|nr:hypothetical protein [Burkholderia multivorans]
MRKTRREIGAADLARDAHEPSANAADHAARRAAVAEAVGQIALDRIAHGHPRIPRAQRGEFVGIGKPCGPRDRIGGRQERNARFHGRQFDRTARGRKRLPHGAARDPTRAAVRCRQRVVVGGDRLSP